MNIQKQNLKILVRGAYDLQKQRIQTGNRIVGNFKAKLGQSPGESEKTLGEEEKSMLEELRLSYKKLTDGLKTFPRQATFKGDGVIDDYTELCLVKQYIDFETTETQHFNMLKNALKNFSIWNDFLEKVKGCGPAMAGIIISEIDIQKAQYPSSLWAYCGMDVAADGKGRSRKKEHLREIEYINKDGKPAKRVGITFNPWLKTKLYVLATCFIKSAGEYREVYDSYKHRLEHHVNWSEKTKGHRHNAAMRYMIKRFLVDLYNKWRELEGLPVAPEYSEAKLGKVHKVAV